MIESGIHAEGLVWRDVREAPFRIFGLYDAQRQDVFRRVPEEVARSVSDGVAGLHTNTAGGRIRFKTNSPYVALHVVFPDVCVMDHFAQTGVSGFDLYRAENGGWRYVGTFRPPVAAALEQQKGYASILYTGEGSTGLLTCDQHTKNTGQKTCATLQEYLIHFPLYNNVSSVHIGLHGDYAVESGGAYRNEKPVVFYGSSITQGGCASRPGNAYPAILSRRLGIDFINLGFSGNGKAEPAIAEYMAGLPMQVFVCDYDYNAPNAEYLQQTHQALYRTIRAKQPELPILLLSKPDTDRYVEETRKRREVIEATYNAALDAGDKNIRFIGGETLFGKRERDDCTVDGVHPNDFGFFRMADAIEDVLREMI